MSGTPTSNPPDMPSRIGGYELLLPIGTGGMGSVYLARRQVVAGVSREYALKVLHPQLRAADDTISDQLLREARLAAHVRHPNVVQVVEAAEDGASVFLAMDYVEGDTLSALIRSSIKQGVPIPVPIVARIILDALEGLQAAHEARDESGAPLHLIHRDFSPQNLLVGVDGITRLSDFGIAKAIGQIGATATGIVKGKVTYMAPEQALGRELDRRCDVWAAGVVLWEALAGRRLYQTSNDAETVLRLVTPTPMPKVSGQRPELDPAVDEVLAGALCYDVRRRISDAAELARRIEAAWQSHGIATAREVAEYVQLAVGEKLAERKRQVTEVVALRESLDNLSARATRRALDSALDIDAPAPSSPARDALPVVPMGPLNEAPGSSPEVTTDAKSFSSAVSLFPRRRARRWAVVAVGVATVVAAIAAGTWLYRRPEPLRAAAVLENAVPVLTIPAASPSPAQTASAATTPTTLTLDADAPIAQLRVGDRNILLADPVRSVEIALSNDERGIELSIRAVSEDGRRAEATTGADSSHLTLSFGDAPRRFVPRRPPRKSSPSDDDGLAASPYGGK